MLLILLAIYAYCLNNIYKRPLYNYSFAKGYFFNLFV